MLVWRNLFLALEGKVEGEYFVGEGQRAAQVELMWPNGKWAIS